MSVCAVSGSVTYRRHPAVCARCGLGKWAVVLSEVVALATVFACGTGEAAHNRVIFSSSSSSSLGYKLN